MDYNISTKKEEACELACKLGIDSYTALFLINRGITDEQKIYNFLYDETLLDSSLILNIDDMVVYINDAIINNTKVCIYGDYDTDGVTSTAILYLGLKRLGVSVSYRIPDRLSEGYGMNVKAIEEIHRNGCELLITVDNGIKNHKEIAYAKSLGMMVIVLDHHTPDTVLPDADVIIDLHNQNETYPYKDLAGCGLAFKVLLYLYKSFNRDINEAMDLIDFAAIGTVADVVPLTGENRILVKLGLKYINSENYNRPSIRALLKLSNIEGELSSSDIAFRIAPILNAPGRLMQRGADISLELLLADSESALEKAQYSISINETRKELTVERMKQAYQYIYDNDMIHNQFLVVYIPKIEHGLIGLISGRLTELYHRPSIVFTDDREGVLKGSGRSIKEVNLYDALFLNRDLIIKFGGHAQAAGLSIEKDKLQLFNDRLNGYMHICYEGNFKKTYDVDMKIELKDINSVLLRSIKNLEPYGECNPCPLFYLEDFNTRIKHTSKGYKHYEFSGVDEQHVKLFGQDYKEDVFVNANGFNLSDQYRSLGYPRKVNMICSIDEYKTFGRENKQLIIKDLEQGTEQESTISNLQIRLQEVLNKL